jgi:hypothetical protein
MTECIGQNHNEGSTMAILCGSRAYGTPREDSDVDLVIQLTLDEELTLREGLGIDPTGTLRIGKLNLIIARTDEQYALWCKGIEELKEMAPVSRQEAIEYFDVIFARCKDGQVVNGANSKTDFEIALQKRLQARAKVTEQESFEKALTEVTEDDLWWWLD